jgi:uncharacterized membrane protein YqiK
MSEHHASCKDSDKVLVWRCAQCGLDEPAYEYDVMVRGLRDALKRNDTACGTHRDVIKTLQQRIEELENSNANMVKQLDEADKTHIGVTTGYLHQIHDLKQCVAELTARLVAEECVRKAEAECDRLRGLAEAMVRHDSKVANNEYKTMDEHNAAVQFIRDEQAALLKLLSRRLPTVKTLETKEE